MPLSARVGAWLFRARGWIPVPFLVATAALADGPSWTTAVGLLLVGVGLGIRVWSVAHIGPSSRTRTAEVKKLIYTGPYELSRNPLYVGNLVLYVALGLLAGAPGWGAVLFVSMVVHYNLIIRWEEWNLEQRLGEVYRSYRNRVPRWIGSSAPVHAATPRESADIRWPRAWRSERSTLVAVGVVVATIIVWGGLAGG